MIISGKDSVDISCDKGGKINLDGGGNVLINGAKVRIN